MLSLWLSGFESLLHGRELLFLLLGTGVGLFFGAVPGLGGTTALALIVPLTYGLDPITALALAGGVMRAVPMGGSITAILLNAPGTAPSAATCLDGYPLAQKGQAGLAIGAAASANAIGGLVGTVSLLLVLPAARRLVLLFGPPEFFLLAVLGLVVVAVSLRGQLLRGLIAGGIGLAVSFVGFDQITGDVRFAFGSEYLWDGIHLVPALIGLFALAEMMNLAVRGGAVAGNRSAVRITRMSAGVRETFRHWPTVLRGSLIGTVVGAVPGVGGVVAAFLSYSVTAQTDRDPGSFGQGNIKGVIAPEAAINAKDGSALIPTLAFGIPGGAEMAVFLGILVLHGMQPGPIMLIQNGREIYGLVWALTASCVLASCVGLLFARPLALVTLLPSTVLVPVVTSVALVGSWAVDQSVGNVLVTLVFGLGGYAMLRLGYPRLTLVIAFVLGGTVERSFHQSLLMTDAGAAVFLLRPICVALIVAIGVALFGGALKRGLGRMLRRRPNLVLPGPAP